MYYNTSCGRARRSEPAAQAVVEQGGGFAQDVAGIAEVGPEVVAEAQGAADIGDGGAGGAGAGGVQFGGAPGPGILEGAREGGGRGEAGGADFADAGGAAADMFGIGDDQDTGAGVGPVGQVLGEAQGLFAGVAAAVKYAAAGCSAAARAA